MPDDLPRVWVPDTQWRTLHPNTHKRCRMPKCGRPAVAELRRSRRGGPCWWAYCEHHLYGRRLANGRIETEVAADGPAAQRGETRA